MREENRVMRIFSALGIIFILCGHLNFGLFEIGGVFPYYSFHVYMFLFVSGYFYDEKVEEHPLKYIGYKAKKLLIPYYIFNLFYGIVSTICIKCGLYYGGGLSLYNLIVAPFRGGHQYMFNAPAWFLIALFEIEVINVIMRRILKAVKLEYDLLIAALVLIVGIATVYLAIGGHVWGIYKDAGRVLIMLPGFYFGLIYRKYLDKLIPTEGKMAYIVPAITAVCVFIIQFIVCKSFAGLAFSTVWVSSFANGPVMPFVTVLTGIIFWLSVAMILSKVLAINSITDKVADGLVLIGRSTMGIMLHHMFVFFLVNLVLYKISLFSGFDTEAFMTDLYYAYEGTGWFKLVYIILGIVIPVLMSMLYKKCRKHLSGNQI